MTAAADLAELRVAHHESVGRLLAEHPDWPAADVEVIEMPDDVRLYRLTLMLCEYCGAGASGECHSPGCSLNLNRAPDLPITTDGYGDLIRLAAEC